MKILPTAMSLMASITSVASLPGVPVEMYYYETMLVYCTTYITMKVFIPKFHHIGSYLEQRFSLTIRILVTCTFILITILYMSVILYGPSLTLSQVTGLNIWIAIGACGLVCTIYTSIGGMKAVIWTDVVQATVIFTGLILSIIYGLIDAGGISKVFETLKNGNRVQLSVFSVTIDPSVRYTIWSILIGSTFSSTAQYACIQTQAQRYMCVKDTKSAQNYMDELCNECDPLRAKLISRPDQLYPLFVVETSGRIPGLTGLFISCILSATLSTFSSGVNSIATVIFEDIYKRLSKQSVMSDKNQVIFSKILSNKHGGRLLISTVGCVQSINVTLSPTVTKQSSNILVSLFSISPLWIIFNGTIIMIILGLIFSFILSKSFIIEIKNLTKIFYIQIQMIRK
ncbi:unnamed protein product [Adineta steineri]|uniref:Uncharacterized protein n=1 Tax=Adineta steineri TaxID=433720 RepID=A0A819UL06_9BILA|nr:unnamed protein product [Adineta steineri]